MITFGWESWTHPTQLLDCALKMTCSQFLVLNDKQLPPDSCLETGCFSNVNSAHIEPMVLKMSWLARRLENSRHAELAVLDNFSRDFDARFTITMLLLLNYDPSLLLKNEYLHVVLWFIFVWCNVAPDLTALTQSLFSPIPIPNYVPDFTLYDQTVARHKPNWTEVYILESQKPSEAIWSVGEQSRKTYLLKRLLRVMNDERV